MHPTSKAILFLSVSSLGLASAQADNSLDCSAKLAIPESVYDSAGLEKLSDAERAKLLEWVQQLHCSEAATAAPQDKVTTTATAGAATSGAVATAEPTKPQAPASTQAQTEADIENFGIPVPTYEENKTMQATVKEPFRGWSGKTVFYLENGQVWRQRVSGKYTYGGDDNRVEISQNALGFFEMRLIAADRSVGVARLR